MSTSVYRTTRVAALAVPVTDMERLLNCGSADAALLYLYTLHSGGTLDTAAAAAFFHRGEADILAAAATLVSIGVLDTAAPLPEPEPSTPAYSRADITRITKNNADFRALVDDTQAAFGRILSAPELTTLIGLWDYLALPADVIMLLVHHGIAEAERRGGPTRRPSFRTLEKQAYAWVNRGITTAERAEAWLAEQETKHQQKNSLSGALGLSSRKLSPTEEKYLEKWTSLGLELPVFVEAYDRTVMHTGKLSWKYMDSIVCAWNEKGFHTLEDVKKGDSRRDSGKKSPSAGGEYKPGRQDLERMKKLEEKLQNGH